MNIDAAFGDRGFAPLKAIGAAFVVVRPDAAEVVWANAAAASHWGASDAAGLALTLFGAGGRGGWLDGLARGVEPGRPPRLARAGLALGFRMRARTALLRAWNDDGSVLLGFASPDAEPLQPADPDDWRRLAWGDRPGSQGGTAPVEAASEPEGSAEPHEAGDPGTVLARRGQLAVLRDRLNHAVDGGVVVRLLWRTDAADAVTQIDTATFTRLASPLRFDRGTMPDAMATFDPAGAERLRAALATRATWSGLAVDLPVAEGAAIVPLVLGASPVLGADRRFAGFRGFGTLDVRRLELAATRPIAAREPDEALGSDEASEPPSAPEAVATGPAAETASSSAATGTSGTDPSPAESRHDPVAPPPAQEPDASEPAADLHRVAAQDRPPVATPEPSGDVEDDPRTTAAEVPEAPRDEPPSNSANVVNLRAFQALSSARVTPPSQPLIADLTPSATRLPAEAPGGAHDAVDRPAEDGEASPSPDVAFLMLGEALRARIAALPPSEAAAEPVPSGASSEAGAAADLDPSLLDQLPLGLAVTVGLEVVFANAAAAARLVGASLAGVPPAARPDAGSAGAADGDPAVLRDARGTAVPARPAAISWNGASATAWILDWPEGSGAASPGTRPAAEDAGAGELLDRVDDAVALLDAGGRVRRLNRQGADWFGALDPMGQSFVRMLDPESRSAALALLDDVRLQRDGLAAPPLRRAVVARGGDGAPRPLLLTMGRLGLTGFYAILRDGAASKRPEAGRARPERDDARDAGRLASLLGKVSHEIRTPLNAVLGFAEIMMDERFGPLGNPRYGEYLKDIHASGTQVMALVEDLLDLSRIEAGQLELAVTAVDVNRVVAETVAQMQPEAHRERVIMRTSLGGRIPSVLADERSTRQIVRNLLSNAVKFNEPGGQVIVSTAVNEGDTVVLRVRDTGVGMNDEEIAAALEPFGGIAASSPAGTKGNGLGLPLTRALVGVNGASMAIRSRPHEGTLVEVVFVAAGPAEDHGPA